VRWSAAEIVTLANKQYEVNIFTLTSEAMVSYYIISYYRYNGRTFIVIGLTLAKQFFIWFFYPVGKKE